MCVLFIFIYLFTFKLILEGAALTAVFDLTSLRIAPFVVCRVFFFLFLHVVPFFFIFRVKNEKDEGTGDYDRAGEGHDVWAGYRRRESKRM